MKLKIYLLFILLVSSCSIFGKEPADYLLRVMPEDKIVELDDKKNDFYFSSIHEAIEECYELSNEHTRGDVKIEIVIQGGLYFVDRPIEIYKERLSNIDALTLKSKDGEKVVFSGGRKISSTWQQVERNLWKTELSDRFNQLFKGDKRLLRSRWPNSWVYPTRVNAEGRTLSIENKFPVEDRISEIELHATGQWHYVRQYLEMVDTNGDGSIIETVTEVGPECSSTKVGVSDRIHFENHLIFVDKQDEWYLDKVNGYCYLYSDVDPNNAEYYYPVTASTISIKGVEGNPVSNIIIDGIHFQYSNWKMGEVERKGIQAGYWGTEIGKPVFAPPAIIEIEHARNISIQNSAFSQLGEGAIALNAGSRNIEITNNIFFDVGSNVIQVGAPSDYVGEGHPLYYDFSNPVDAPSDIKIKNNLITNCATTDLGGVGILVAYANHVVIEHNTIRSMPYTGISLGWRWDQIPSNTHNNLVNRNYVYKCLQYVSDGAGIYTVGFQPGTVISNNLIEETGGCEKLAFGIYTDEGSAAIKVYNNIINASKGHDYYAHQNNRGTMQIIGNNQVNGDNTLVVKSDRLQYADFEDILTVDRSLYGRQP